MIAKKIRLQEKELKKVLQRWKPFFSFGIVLNYLSNRLAINRFWIVISAKSVPSNVSRNYFRRHFYSLIQESSISKSCEQGYDFVFVVKKDRLLDKKNEKSIREFVQDIQFLLKKMDSIQKK